MSVNVEAFCTMHGPGVEVFRIGDRRFCRACVCELLEKHCSEITMVTIEDRAEEEEPDDRTLQDRCLCSRCGFVWFIAHGTYCPQCGKAAKGRGGG